MVTCCQGRGVKNVLVAGDSFYFKTLPHHKHNMRNVIVLHVVVLFLFVANSMVAAQQMGPSPCRSFANDCNTCVYPGDCFFCESE
jgi:hypothetical protein